MTCTLKARKTAPCFGFVFMSVYNCSVGQCLMVISSQSTLSLMRKYSTLMCFVRLELLAPLLKRNFNSSLDWSSY